MNLNNASFVISTTNLTQWPKWKLPEIMVYGKSNVGKSTFINILTNYNKLSKVSSTPGKTQLLNFFNIDDTFGLVDAPGYGYALAAKTIIASFSKMINDYLIKRKNCKLIILLLDARHKPTSKDLIIFNNFLELDKNVLIVATKWDKLNQKQQHNCEVNFGKVLSLNPDEFIRYSSKNKYNLNKIIKIIKQIIKK